MVIKCSNRRQEICPLKPHSLNPIKKFMQLSLHSDASNIFFLHDFNKISTKGEKCGKNDLLLPFLDASVKRHTH